MLFCTFLVLTGPPPLSYSFYFVSLRNCHVRACFHFFHALEPTNPWRQVMIYAVTCLEANFLTWSMHLVVFGPSHFVLCNSSHVGNASLPLSCVLQFTSDAASLVLSFALDVPLRIVPFPSLPPQTYPPSSRCRRNRPLLVEKLQLALHKVCTSPFSLFIIMDRWAARELVSSLLIVQILPFRRHYFPNIVCVLNDVLPCNFFPYHILFLLICRQDRLRRSLNGLRCPYFR